MTESSTGTGWPRRYGRYLVFEEFARGGMASVHLGRLVADRGFSRLVAVKMLSADRAASSFYARALEDEARIASRIRHPNVVQPIDVVAERGDVLYVMEYVHGVSLAHLLHEARTNGDRVPEDVAVAVMVDVLSALHAAHEAKDETGRPLGVVHRDVSPQNVLVGLDGLARLADFGVAKAMRREERTATGAVKGKPSYMAPEQQRGLPLSRQADVYAAGVVLAVALTDAPLAPEDDGLADAWLQNMIATIKDRALLDVVVTATKAQARDRYATAAEMARALAAGRARATAEAVGACVQDLAGDVLERRGELARRVESAGADADADANANADANADAEAKAKATVRATAGGRGPRPRRLLPAFVVLFTASAVLGAYLLLSARARRGSGGESGAATAVLLGTIASADAPPAAGVTSAAGPPPTAAAPPTPAARPRPTAPRPHAAAAPAPPEDRPAAPAVDCDPPFRIDAQGRKHYKPECAQ
jgi:eukaryotic-like serine/threonine-protein kinase